MTHDLANGPLCVFQKNLSAGLYEVVFICSRLIIVIFTDTRFRKTSFILEGWKFEGFWS